MSNLPLDSIEAITKALLKATSSTRVDLLKHYLLNFILLMNLPREKLDTPIREKLLKISVLLDRTSVVRDEIEKEDRRVVEDVKRRPRTVGPREKFRRSSERQRERVQERSKKCPRDIQ